MGLDITITRRMTIRCPNCHDVVAHIVVDTVESGGRDWYPFLETIGYYVPYEQRNPSNDWYGKDRVLEAKDVGVLRQHMNSKFMLNEPRLLNLITTAEREGHDVVINADW